LPNRGDFSGGGAVAFEFCFPVVGRAFTAISAGGPDEITTGGPLSVPFKGAEFACCEASKLSARASGVSFFGCIVCRTGVCVADSTAYPGLRL
jgi:hypothetical protein